MSIICLTAKIKGLASESQKLTSDIKSKKHKLDKASYQSKYWWYYSHKRELGIDTRHHLLAYAFIRNIPYCKVENKCEIKPSVDKIFKVVSTVGYILRPSPRTGSMIISSRSEEKMKEEIQAWLAGGV